MYLNVTTNLSENKKLNATSLRPLYICIPAKNSNGTMTQDLFSSAVQGTNTSTENSSKLGNFEAGFRKNATVKFIYFSWYYNIYLKTDQLLRPRTR